MLTLFKSKLMKREVFCETSEMEKFKNTLRDAQGILNSIDIQKNINVLKNNTSDMSDDKDVLEELAGVVLSEINQNIKDIILRIEVVEKVIQETYQVRHKKS